MKFLQYITISLLLGVIFASCEEAKVEFNSDTTVGIQAQKFNYADKVGAGKVYEAKYSEDKTVLNLDITYFPDEEAPTYQDWQLHATIARGAKIAPAMSGIKDLSEPIELTVTAPDGTTSNVTLITKIYEVPYGELEHGFGRYNKLFEKTATQMGNWSTDAQTSMAVVGDELIINHNNQGAFLVYNKKTGEKVNKTVALPKNGERIFAITNDADDKMVAVSYGDASNKTTPIRIYRWKDGIDKAPETFYELKTSLIDRTNSAAIGANIGLFGSLSGDAQIMLAMDGRGGAYDGVVRLSVSQGAVAEVEVFNAPLGSVWSGFTAPASATKRLPYVTASGNQRGFIYTGSTGSYSFEVDPANSNFLNKSLVTGVKYFEFNNAKYIASTSVSWPGDVRLLLFNVDDPSLIPTKKADEETYKILNPFSETSVNKGTSANDNGTGNVAIQISADGKTAYIYALETNNLIMGYELTNIGAAK